MIERLQRALERVDELSPEAQEELAAQIEAYAEASDQTLAVGSMVSRANEGTNESFAGIWADLPEDFLDELDRIRHESKPTPPIELDEP